jgi:hypothetical protein
LTPLSLPSFVYANQRQRRAFPSVFNESGEIHDALGFVGVPDTLFYGADGSIVATWSGPLTSDALRTNINRLVSG